MPIARLTWQSADPALLAEALRLRLGVTPVRERDGFAVPLGSATLELVPWRPEHEADAASGTGRLVFEPAWDPSEVSGVEAGPGDGVHLVAVGWSTVDLDRAESELDMWLEPADADPVTRNDAHLGAAIRVREAPELPGARLAFAEPDTEGRLAASLARDGEGPCALYLDPADGLAAWSAAARTRGVTLARADAGPFGPQVLVLGSPVAGPHLVIVDMDRHSSPARGAGTIAS